MKVIHAVIALALSAVLLAIVAGAATANVPMQGPVKLVDTHKDISIPSTYSTEPMTYKTTMGHAKPSATVAPTKVKRYNKVTGGAIRIKPSATVSPTKVKRYNQVTTDELRIKPSATVSPTKVKRSNIVTTDELRTKPSPTTKHLQLLGRKPTPVPTVRATASPRPVNRVATPAQTPAKSYGISGVGGVTPYFKPTPHRSGPAHFHGRDQRKGAVIQP